MTPTILLIGSGNIGRRHLQALQATERPLRIIIVEPSEQARAASQSIIPTGVSSVDVALQANFTSIPPQCDLAIIATTALHRRAALETMLNSTTPSTVLLEKVLFTTRRDIDEVQAKFSADGIPAFVNCGRRGWPGYENLRRTLASRRGVSIEVTGSQWGLCSNSVHLLDLVDYALGDDILSLSEEMLEAEPDTAKRDGCVELYGTLAGKLAGGGSLSLTCLREPGTPVTVKFVHGREQWEVAEAAGIQTYRHDKTEQTVPFETRFVSTMPYLYTEILDGKPSRLTPYKVSAIHHKLFIDAIRRRLNLSLFEDVPCPIS